jgi:hypothetical protein
MFCSAFLHTHLNTFASWELGFFLCSRSTQQGFHHGGRSPQPLTLKITENIEASWHHGGSNKSLCSGFIEYLATRNSGKYTEQEVSQKYSLLLPSDDGAQWSVSGARILATTARRNVSSLDRKKFEVDISISLIVVFRTLRLRRKGDPSTKACGIWHMLLAQ